MYLCDNKLKYEHAKFAHIKQNVDEIEQLRAAYVIPNLMCRTIVLLNRSYFVRNIENICTASVADSFIPDLTR